MSSDFRADRFRGSRLILSGNSADEPAFLIYSASIASDSEGGISDANFSNFGTDVFMVVSGSSGSMGTSTRGTTLFIGDVYFSGALRGDIPSGPIGPTGPTGATGAQGPTGEFGGASFEYNYATNTADSDPGSTNIKFNNSTISSATKIYIDDEDIDATDIQPFLRTIDDSTSAIKGHVKISEKENPEKFVLFTISGLTENAGYFTVDVSSVSSSAVLPSIVAGTGLVTTFARTGDVGDKGDIPEHDWLGTTLRFQNANGSSGSYVELVGPTGATGAQGLTGSAGGTSFRYNFSSSTVDAEPSSGYLRLNNATQNASTVMHLSFNNVFGTDLSTYFNSLDDSTSTIKGHLKITSRLDNSKFLLFTISSISDEVDYLNISISNVSSSTSSPFLNSDSIFITFTRTGDKGLVGDTGLKGDIPEHD